MIVHTIQPIALSLGPLQVHWYGLLFVAGILAVYHIAGMLAKRKGISYGKDWLSEAALYVVLGMVIGARLGHVISAAGFYAAHPLQIIAIWSGGLAFHGGLAGGLLAGYLYCRKRKVRFLQTADLIMVPLALALALGRAGNFVNSEFYGTATQLPWGVVFTAVDNAARHPVQLYEAAAMLLLFGILWKMKDRKLPDGALLWLFLVLYAMFRFPLEYLKVDVTHYGFLTWGQFWSIPMLLIGAAMLWRVRKKRAVAAPSD